jgi:hypothetical protein
MVSEMTPEELSALLLMSFIAYTLLLGAVIYWTKSDFVEVEDETGKR